MYIVWTRMCRRKEVLRAKQWKAAEKLFITEYIKFYVTAKTHERNEKRMVEQKREGGCVDKEDNNEMMEDQSDTEQTTESAFVNLNSSDDEDDGCNLDFTRDWRKPYEKKMKQQLRFKVKIV